MNIAEIKLSVSHTTGMPIGTLDLRGTDTGTFDAQGKPVIDLSWQYAWIEGTNAKGEAKRIRIVFPKEVVDTLKGNITFNGLAAKHEVIPPHKAGDINPVTKKPWTTDLEQSYERFTIITPQFTASF